MSSPIRRATGAIIEVLQACVRRYSYMDLGQRQASDQRSLEPRASNQQLPEAAKPIKALGQHFLIQPRLACRIAECLEIQPGDEVIEIGAGHGALTEYLVRSEASRIVAVEIDSRLASILRARFSSDERIQIICADFLELDLANLVARAPVKIVGNLPFFAATSILLRLGQWRSLIGRLVLMFQREVAERLRATPGERAYGMLTVLNGINFSIIDHFRVGAGNFYPRPQVDAEVLVMIPKQSERGQDDEELVRLIRASFSNPRKKLRNSLSFAFKVDPEEAERWLSYAGIDPTSRAQNLTLQDFISLLNARKAFATST